MVTSVVKLDKTIVVDTDNILYRLEKSFIYGVSLEIWIGTANEFNLAVEDEYKLYFNDKESATFTLTERDTDIVGKQHLKIYKFTNKTLHNNT